MKEYIPISMDDWKPEPKKEKVFRVPSNWRCDKNYKEHNLERCRDGKLRPRKSNFLPGRDEIKKIKVYHDNNVPHEDILTIFNITESILQKVLNNPIDTYDKHKVPVYVPKTERELKKCQNTQ